MPDLLTHAGIAAVPGFLFRDPRTRFLLIFGAFLPDLMEKGIFGITRAPIGFSTPAHSLPGLLVLCYLMALFLEEPLRIPGFFALYAGSLLHILSDLPKDYFGTGSIPLWFPFSYRLEEIRLIAPEDTIFFAPAGLLVLAILLRSEWKPRHE